MKATIRVETDRVIGRASELLRGQFLEHVHRCIDHGIYEEGSPLSDERGFRKDVLALLKPLRPSVLRYPGGNFSCDYDWREGVLPKDKRPRRFSFGTQQVGSYRFGTHEFLHYCRELGAQPLLTVNAGNGTPELAAAWVEYCNATYDGEYVRLRRSNGFEEPWGVRYWCIGNEVYGDWVPGTKTGDEYARFVAESAKLMRWVDPEIKLVGMATGTYLPDWDRASIDATVDLVDFVSLHIYVGRHNYYDCVGSPVVVQKGIDIVHGAIEAAACKKNLAKLPKIALDEYNVWYRTRHFPDGLEERFNLQDALAFAGIQNVLRRNADRVGMACVSMVANCLGPILTSQTGAFRQTIYWVLRLVADYFAEEVVDCFVQCPAFTCRHPKHFAGVIDVDSEGREIETETRRALMWEFEGLPYLDVCTMVDRARSRLVLSVVNRHETEEIETRIEILGSRISGTVTGDVLTARSVKAENSFEYPDAVTPAPISEFPAANEFTYRFLPHSYTVLSVAQKSPIAPESSGGPS